MKSRYQRSLSLLAFTFFLGVGTYNAVVINSESSIDGANIRFVKRLDELYGVQEPGRLVANSLPWQKIPSPQGKEIKDKAIVQEVRTILAAPESPSAPAETPTAAAVQEELNLNLVEVVNPKKWQQGLSPGQFSGSLSTSNGTIESLSVSLPQGESVSISFSEMTGNVFEYDLGGEIYSGMMYQVDQNSYMITLSNGPLEGTRMKFMGENTAQIEQQAEEAVAQQGTNTETDNFGNNSEQGQEVAANDQPAADNQMQAQEAPVSDFQPAEVPAPEALPEQQQQDVAFQNAPSPEEAANMDLQFQQQAQAYNMEQAQIN